jgi:hypothetical protein
VTKPGTPVVDRLKVKVDTDDRKAEARKITETAEEKRLIEPFAGHIPPWRVWGPYLSERSWGTVREDYSENGDAWNFFTHDMARSKAYRWGEDGLAGICDRYQLLCFSLALWNGRDPILKERMFGLTPSEGNRGEDVKDYYFYVDSTPTHSYMKMVYKYPQGEYPYQKLVDENRSRGGRGFEYELLDTGIFDEDKYFDVVVEYAKAAPDDLCIRFEIFNRGPEAADVHLLPHLWFRNTWAWTDPPGAEPVIQINPKGGNGVCLLADDTHAKQLSNLKFAYGVGKRYLQGPPSGQPLFTNNETNNEKLYGVPNRKPHVKDAFHGYVVNGEDCVNHANFGSKACIHYKYRVPARSSVVLRLRLTNDEMQKPLEDVDQVVQQRLKEADEFYACIHPPKATEDEKLVQRQAFAGMLWSKMLYLFDVDAWLEGDNPKMPPPASRQRMRNAHWRHLNSMRILTIPDKWEYPWFAAWDLAFQTLTLALVDPQAARDNLWIMLFEQFQHPSGQLPAYEWEFSDLNPPVHAWAVYRVYQTLQERRPGEENRGFLEKCFHKLMINFAWWVNRVDSEGLNVFEGGFLGLDNITVVDRSEKLPDGARLEQSDATGWMGFFCLYMMRIALELAKENPTYESLATKFFQHFVYIGAAMKKMGGRRYQLWDEDDGFFYDVLRWPDGNFTKFRVRSLVGLIPLYAIQVLAKDDLEPQSNFLGNVDWFIRNRQDIVGRASFTVDDNGDTRYVLSIVDPTQLTRLVQRIWDPDEFLSPAGLRSLSKHHEKNPFRFGNNEVCYEPAEADVKIKGGNSNWRGPIWFPTSYLLIESMVKFSQALGPDFKIQTPAEKDPVNLYHIAEETANRMIGLFTRNAEGKRPIYAGTRKFQEDPHWRDLVLFNEYFHGDNGAGLGANHQTGWTGLVANLIDNWRR